MKRLRLLPPAEDKTWQADSTALADYMKHSTHDHRKATRATEGSDDDKPNFKGTKRSNQTHHAEVVAALEMAEAYMKPGQTLVADRGINIALPATSRGLYN